MTNKKIITIRGDKFRNKIKMENKENKEAIFDVICPDNKWELWLNGFIKETGTGNIGLFVEAKNEKEAIKYFKALIKIIKENSVKMDDEGDN